MAPQAYTAIVLLLIFSIATSGVSAGKVSAAVKMSKSEKEMSINFENEYLEYSIGQDSRIATFTDKRKGIDYCRKNPAASFARIVINGKTIDSTTASLDGDKLTVGFGDSGVATTFVVNSSKHFLTFEVASINSEDVQEMTFSNVRLTTTGEANEPFAGCALAMNVNTNVPELPQSNNILRAISYKRIGHKGAKVAIIGCPKDQLRKVMQEAVSSSPDLPHSSLGGPWALDNDINYGSYLFNFGDLSESKADDWIKLAKSLGITQIDFHGGASFRFGDFKPNPNTYPNGKESMKAVIDRLHKEGIAAGLHTYAFFIDKGSKYVTPIPDQRLGKDATFTLADDLSADSDKVTTVESTENMSTITGFFVHNSVTVQVDDELIVYGDISKQPPYAFTKCQRGAYGTKAASHAKGAKVHHLKECFGLFVPDADTTLFTEIAAKTAEMFNDCGFDMIYLDALDGEGILGGHEFGWHYGSKFVFEIWKHLKRPALQEMSIFHHHLWFVRSRMGAWDHPSRSHKKFIDIHCQANESNKKMFLPGHLGWWAFKTQMTANTEPTFTDDIEYLCCKAIGTGCGLSIMGVDPYNIQQNAALARLSAVVKEYEELRRANYFSESVKAQLKQPGKDFTLVKDSKGKAQVLPVDYVKHKIEGCDERTNPWTVSSKYDTQPVQLRIEALYSASPYDSPDNITLADFTETGIFGRRDNSPAVKAALSKSSKQVKTGEFSGCYTAFLDTPTNPEAATEDKFSPIDHGVRNPGTRPGGWSRIGRQFTPSLDLKEGRAIGAWIYGDNNGGVLNFQLRSPVHVSGGISDHYILVDFTGWRYFELVESEGENSEACGWPYSGSVYNMYRELVNYNQIDSFDIWYGNLPAGKKVECYISPVKALSLVKNKIHNPKITINGKTIEFPIDMESGSYLEFKSITDCKLYGPNGELLADVKPIGDTVTLKKGENRISFTGEGMPGINTRARVTVISKGEPVK